MTKYQSITLPNKTKIQDEKKPDSESILDKTMEDYIETARGFLTEAGEDVNQQAEAISKIVNQLILYDNSIKMMLHVDKLAKEFKIKKGDFNLAIKEAHAKRKSEAENNEETSAQVTRVELYIKKRYQIYFNIVANKFMYREHNQVEFKILNEHNIYRELQKAHIRYSMSDLKSLLRSDFVEEKNPFIDYFEKLPAWDGDDHIEKLAGYITVQEPSEFSNEKDRFLRMFKKMFVRSVACSLEVSFNKQCFTLVDEKQNTGKSTFLRWLCPPQLEDYYTENIGTSKDDLIALTENIIINQDELSTLSKFEINALKSVMTKQKVKVRLPYGERPELLHRRCNFVASTNRLEFLNDETGSTRWVCFLLDRIDWCQTPGERNYKTDIDINKVWAQAYHLFKETDFNYQLTPAEIEENEKANKTFLIRSPEMELIQKYFTPATKQEYDKQVGNDEIHFRTATEILTEINQKNMGNIKLNAINVGKSLKILGFKQYPIYKNDIGISVKGYFAKYKDNENNKQEIAEEIRNSTEPKNEELPF